MLRKVISGLPTPPPASSGLSTVDSLNVAPLPRPVHDQCPMIDPAAAYAQRLQDREQRLARLRARHRALVWARIVELFLALCVAYVAFAERKAPVSVAWSAFALFGVLTGAIVWVEELIVRREAVVRYYQRGVAR